MTLQEDTFRVGRLEREVGLFDTKSHALDWIREEHNQANIVESTRAFDEWVIDIYGSNIFYVIKAKYEEILDEEDFATYLDNPDDHEDKLEGYNLSLYRISR